MENALRITLSTGRYSRSKGIYGQCFFVKKSSH
jgi:hypothetical protein